MGKRQGIQCIITIIIIIIIITIIIIVIIIIIMTKEIMTFIINTITVPIDIARFARFHLSH